MAETTFDFFEVRAPGLGVLKDGSHVLMGGNENPEFPLALIACFLDQRWKLCQSALIILYPLAGLVKHKHEPARLPQRFLASSDVVQNGLDKKLDIVTISTNPAEVQTAFAHKAKIGNILFLSDAPNYEFGEKTGLLRTGMKFLMRTVMVVDENNIIQYVDFVPGGGLPQIEQALKAAEQVLAKS